MLAKTYSWLSERTIEILFENWKRFSLKGDSLKFVCRHLGFEMHQNEAGRA